MVVSYNGRWFGVGFAIWWTASFWKSNRCNKDVISIYDASTSFQNWPFYISFHYLGLFWISKVPRFWLSRFRIYIMCRSVFRIQCFCLIFILFKLSTNITYAFIYRNTNIDFLCIVLSMISIVERIVFKYEII